MNPSYPILGDDGVISMAEPVVGAKYGFDFGEGTVHAYYRGDTTFDFGDCPDGCHPRNWPDAFEVAPADVEMLEMVSK